MRRGREDDERTPSQAPRIILLIIVVFAMTVGLRQVSRFLKVSTPKTDKALNESIEPPQNAIQHSFRLKGADGEAESDSQAPKLREIPLEDAGELVLRGRSILAPMDRWIVLRTPSGWGAFQLREISANHGASPEIECVWYYRAGDEGRLGDEFSESGRKSWRLTAIGEANEADEVRTASIHCGPVNLIWSEFTGIALPAEPRVAIALSRAIDVAGIDPNSSELVWLTNSTPSWSAPQGGAVDTDGEDYVGRPPEPTALDATPEGC
ncbi:MAG: hypothetical protein KDA42_05025 [Planctomycetales bacterium]|nr:hypothetical protein [Planctomycetales bacterium]